jgi:hypothetical protein
MIACSSTKVRYRAALCHLVLFYVTTKADKRIATWQEDIFRMTPQHASSGQTPNMSDDEITDEEANEEIDIPTSVAPVAPPAPRPTPKPATPPRAALSDDDTTPSVKEAIDKAADILRELRGER